LPEHVRKVEDEDERRKRLLCILVLLPFIFIFLCLLSSSSSFTSTAINPPSTTITSPSSTFHTTPTFQAATLSFFEYLTWASLAVVCGLLGLVALRRGAHYATALALALWTNFAVLSLCFHYGFVPELFCVLAALPPLLFFVFGRFAGACALATVLLEGALFPHVASLIAGLRAASASESAVATIGYESRPPGLQMSPQGSLVAALAVAYVVGLTAWLQDGSRAAYRDKMRAIVLQSEAANRELQQATAAKSNFLANMSHGIPLPPPAPLRPFPVL
jgi:signal transduction histidine kinase